MQAEETNGRWVPRVLSELRIYERGSRHLCLNPEVPAWIVTSPSSVLLLQLVDGTRSVDDIADLLVREQIPVDPGHVRRFFAEARDARLFDGGTAPAGEDGDPWRNRKLTAMHLHLTDRCNLQCSYCLRESHPNLPIRHEPARFLEMLDFIEPCCAPGMKLTYCGGEPLLYPGFCDVVEAASRHGYRNQLLTNGLLITEPMADFIDQHFVNVKISLDGGDRASHAATRGDNFDRVLRGIHRVANRHVEVIVQVTVTQANLATVGGIRALLPDSIKLTFTPMLPMGRGADATGFVSDDEFLEVMRMAAADSVRRPEPQFVSGVVNRSCHAGTSNVSVADTGDVYPCHLFHVSPFRLGNIFHDAFEDIFYGEKLREYVHLMDVSHNNSICSACEMRYLCGGGCKANTLHSTGDFRGVDLYCGFIKRSIVDSLFNAVEDPGLSAATGPESEVLTSL